jgi:RimJ/RimL family protein N-acetyltransferase|tara:strand:+ start:547 stop:1341 length:795 start_codon:yes stop_codon:yes gene_type:complete
MMSSPINRARVQAVILDMLSAEQYCGQDDLLDGLVHVVEAGPTDPEGGWIPGGRWFDRPDPYFSMVSVGVGGVVSASPELMPWVVPLFEGADRDQMMEPVRISEVSTHMAEHGQKTFGPFPRWVCAEEDLREYSAPTGYSIEIRDDEDDRHVVMAQQAASRRPGERTTHQFRVVANGSQGPVGSAGVTADGDGLYQIHIAITEEHRGRGLGRALTYAITRATFDYNAVPYYGTTSVNTWSMRTAIACGFHPSWVHMFARDVRPG